MDYFYFCYMKWNVLEWTKARNITENYDQRYCFMTENDFLSIIDDGEYRFVCKEAFVGTKYTISDIISFLTIVYWRNSINDDIFQ